MDQQYIKENLEKILSLNEEAYKQRELYLKGLATGKIQGPPTNIPTIDETWVKNYTDETLLSEKPKMSMFDFLYENNKDHLDDIALIFEMKKITYRELFENIDNYAKTLISNGVKEGDSVALPIPTTPEAVYLFYAIIKIGAVANLIDLRKPKEEITSCLNRCHSKMMFSLDIAEPKMVKAIEETEVENVISLSAVESLPTAVQFLYNPKQFIKNKQKKVGIRSLKEFLSSKRNDIEYVFPEYKEDRPAFVVYTSGTTALSKAVELTSDTANTRVHQYMTNGMIYDRQDIYLNVIPLFLAFGVIVGLHLPLSMGMKDVLIPSYDMTKTLDYLKKWKPQHLSMTPASFVQLINSKGFDKLDTSMIYTWGCGGDGMSPELENIINTKIQEQGTLHKVSNGYGASEIGAPFSTQKDGLTVPGSVGAPLPGNNVIIYDHITKEILPANTIGDVCMIVDHGMNEYKENIEMTEKTRIEFPNGKIGIMLEDAGYVDENGNLFIKGRFKDALMDKEGEIVWPVDIENLVISTGLVKNCAAVSLNNQKDNIGIFVELNDNITETEFKNKFDLVLYEKNINSLNLEIHYLEKMLFNANGKIDRKTLSANYSTKTM